MNQKRSPENIITELESRVYYLEHINRLSLDALDQAARLGDFQTSINQMTSPTHILTEAHTRIRSLIPFEAVAFFLVNEENSEFYLSECKPLGFDRFINTEVENAIENGSFAWAIREQRPLFISTMDGTKKLLFHVLTTASRVRGMFVGVLTYGEMDVPLVSLSLMSIILLHSANALESYELYSMIKGINRRLEKTVAERTKELEISLAQLRHAQKMEALGRLAGGVAHDFNNILTAITIAAEVSLQDQGLPTTTSKNLYEILKASERAANLTYQLLAFSRKQIIKPKLLDLNSLTVELNKMLSRLIPEDIEISLHFNKNLHLIKADPTQVEQVLINLTINAQDAINESPRLTSEKKITIDISEVQLSDYAVEQKIVDHKGNYIRIRIADTGIGMSEETISKIFDPFFTTKSEGKGTGLGLATVYGIVKQNHGGITVDSIPGQGTTFHVYWPCIENDQPNPIPETKSTSIQGGNETILLVEDDTSVQENIQTLLSSIGYQVLTASSTPEALNIAKNYQKPIHIVFTDLSMPKMDGRQLAHEITTLHPQSKIILSSGYLDNTFSFQSQLPPNYELIEKPYSITDITRLIRKMLDKPA